MEKYRSVSQYREFLTHVYMYAPSEFPAEDYLEPHEQMNLERAFDDLLGSFSCVKQRITDPDLLLVLRELLLMSLEAYRNDDVIRGTHILQEFEGLIWPSVKMPAEYEPVARQRIAGDVARHEK